MVAFLSFLMRMCYNAYDIGICQVEIRLIKFE